MANLAGLAGIAIFGAVLFGFLALLDLFHVNGPELPQWANKAIALFLTGCILSLLVIAFSTGKSWYQRRKPPWR